MKRVFFLALIINLYFLNIFSMQYNQETLLKAAKDFNLGLVEQCIDAGVDFNAKDTENNNILMILFQNHPVNGNNIVIKNKYALLIYKLIFLIPALIKNFLNYDYLLEITRKIIKSESFEINSTNLYNSKYFNESNSNRL